MYLEIVVITSATGKIMTPKKKYNAFLLFLLSKYKYANKINVIDITPIIKTSN